MKPNLENDHGPAHASPSFSRHIPAFLSGEDSPRHFLERCLEKIALRDDAIHAFVNLNIDGARRAADDASVRYRAGRPISAVDGMPFGIKDIIETRDLPTEMNSPIFAGFQPRRDAACVLALKRAGGVLLGKTATAEFACGRSPRTRNPVDTTLTPGGSSSGSAAAVGAGMVPAALGTQSQASTIRPASYCGVFGFKPTHGLLCVDGVAPLAPTLDHLGVFTLDLADAWAITTTIAAAAPGRIGLDLATSTQLPAPSAPGTLVRLETKGWQETDEASKTAFENMLHALQSAGVAIADRRSDPEIGKLEDLLLEADKASIPIYAYEAQWPLRAYAATGEFLVGERILELISIADNTSRTQYEEALNIRDKLRAAILKLRARTQGFITLASSGPAKADIAYTGSRSFAVPGTLSGIPAISLPLLQSAGLPLGLQLLGFPGEDDRAIALARWLHASTTELKRDTP